MLSKKTFLFFLLLHISLTYTYEQFSFWGPLIVFLALFTLPKKTIGLKWKTGHFFLFFTTAMLTYIAAFFYLSSSFTVTRPTFSHGLYILFQTLTEDIVLGFFLLHLTRGRFLLPWAIFFSLQHQILYTNPFRYKSEPLTLVALTLLTLFGFIRLKSMERFKNISLSWGLHLGFNLVFFCLDRSDITEPELFNKVFSLKEEILDAVTHLFGLLR